MHRMLKRLLYCVKWPLKKVVGATFKVCRWAILAYIDHKYPKAPKIHIVPAPDVEYGVKETMVEEEWVKGVNRNSMDELLRAYWRSKHD